MIKICSINYLVSLIVIYYTNIKTIIRKAIYLDLCCCLAVTEGIDRSESELPTDLPRANSLR